MPPPQQPPTRRASSRVSSRIAAAKDVDGDPDIIDGAEALRASPDSTSDDHTSPVSPKLSIVLERPEDGVSQNKEIEVANTPTRRPTPTTLKPFASAVGTIPTDSGLEDDIGGTAEELQEALGRPPPVNSDYLPLPWKGRLGYACLNTYLRTSNPPVFSSRTCRIASIIEHRHPLAEPTQPEHAIKNRPDSNEPASVERGQRYVEAIGLANARDIIKMVRWNDKYGIKFMRLSSEMFPFASHEEYGYTLAPFASETLAEAGKVIAKLGHRVSTHPGQFTQLGSPRKSVIANAIRDLEYHDEMLSLLKLPRQMDKDAVMVLHMGGVFGDKQAALSRFRENHARLSPGIKNRLVLENDDVSWSVHELLPICQELNIPLVLDYHHHNIIFDNTKVREGTLDIMGLYDEIADTWKRKGITQKMHYSEPTAPAITGRQRRKHSARVMTLPPCSPTMDLMIEAKDKEQSVFELMRTFKLPGFERFSNIIPYQRDDESKAAIQPRKTKRKKATAGGDNEAVDLGRPAIVISEEDTGMGGPHGRVYWPPGMEEWLKPPKRESKKKDTDTQPATRRTPARRPRGKKTVVSPDGDGDFNRGKDDVKSGVGSARDVEPSRTKKTARRKTMPVISTPASPISEPQSEEEIMPVSKRARLKRGQ